MTSFIEDLKNEREKKESFIITVIIHLLLLMAFVIPMIKYLDPPKPVHAIAINFTTDIGEPEFEMSEKIGEAKRAEKKATLKPATTSAVVKSELSKPKESIPSAEKVRSQPVIDVQKTEQVFEEESIPLVKASVTDVVTKEDVEEKQTEKPSEEPAAEEETLENKHPTEEEKVNERKSVFANLFKQSTNASSNNSDEIMKPTTSDIGDLVEGNSAGANGIAGRQIIKTPRIQDDSNDVGTVAVRICVNSNGDVISSDFQQTGSTTTSSNLIDLAKKGVFDYRFSKSKAPEQCGTITIQFKGV